ncbi:MAG: hypothetical protein ACI906_003847, partial [Candidatus Latescibacterota bacterium]|jgi:hypothetical protein
MRRREVYHADALGLSVYWPIYSGALGAAKTAGSWAGEAFLTAGEHMGRR